MIVIPMAGLSSRFKKAGYQQPKFMLLAKDRTLFEHSVLSFENYFKTEHFIFIARKENGIKDFITEKCRVLGIEDYRVIFLSKETKGQAETVYKGLKSSGAEADESLTIFNIDTFRPGYKYPSEFDVRTIDGYLETFIGTGENWSNVVPLDRSKKTVRYTAEKMNISEYCCTGLYYWRRSADFERIFEKYVSSEIDSMQGGEYYIAPMYNLMIGEGKDIRFSVVDREDVVFCGVPSEYEEFLDSNA